VDVGVSITFAVNIQGCAGDFSCTGGVLSLGFAPGTGGTASENTVQVGIVNNAFRYVQSANFNDLDRRGEWLNAVPSNAYQQRFVLSHQNDMANDPATGAPMGNARLYRLVDPPTGNSNDGLQCWQIQRTETGKTSITLPIPERMLRPVMKVGAVTLEDGSKLFFRGVMAQLVGVNRASVPSPQCPTLLSPPQGGTQVFNTLYNQMRSANERPAAIAIEEFQSCIDLPPLPPPTPPGPPPPPGFPTQPNPPPAPEEEPSFIDQYLIPIVASVASAAVIGLLACIGHASGYNLSAFNGVASESASGAATSGLSQ